MAKPRKMKWSTILFVVVLLLLIIPQTRKPIQIFLQKGMAKVVKPSAIENSERASLSTFNWKLKNDQGETVNFKSAEGKVIIINFWATWCPPCIAEMPDFETLYQDYKDNDAIEFWFVSNEKQSVTANFLEEKGYSFKSYQPSTQPPSNFNVSSIPRTFVIDTAGKIVLDKSGVADWDSDKMRRILDGLIENKFTMD
ncbi:TlpA family protein disulfide reductase [Subsaximicrobium wynnwilliamsii]|uniref:TlpA family protein disulfide reductase n=1 Tax=Subsaximicrobium wynnwilliamsii TaxID=291179 RepID=A0A5C6ZKI3_9FLAO|nr:TlpA disulfide reductase family protein [Subsaximicrobium wynnwilliamsii]TXD84233.1 TlpA family protein disulfide reductase [Subsaximicrobium wynnwilliamsii]TXD89854.1 TlpA family protein disulfide reductase [Subsaximicrobium wynnwilliamsii]TXE03945.1 TlpA family protein disulfide reductase [Subsaximicrobium wynnwilliamsii]